MPLNPQSSVFTLQSDTSGVLEIRSSDIGKLGNYAVVVTADMIEYPTVVTSRDTVIPFSFERCPVDVLEWTIPDLSVPPSESIMIPLPAPEFDYTIVTCNYYWSSYTLTLTDSESGSTLTSEQSSTWASFTQTTLHLDLFG